MIETKGQDWITELRQKGLSAVEGMYQQWRSDFLAFAQRYQVSEEDRLDAYQDAIIILYENVRSGKLTELSSSPKTYLFSIGKYTLLNKQKAARKQTTLETAQLEDRTDWEVPTDELAERQQKMYQVLKQLGASCQELIQLFYYQRLSIKEIVLKTGLKNENTVKAQKSRCIKSLRERLGTAQK